MRRSLVFSPVVLLAALLLMVIVAGARTDQVGAQVALPVCRAAMILDRSGSIGTGQMNQMRNQIRRLFEPTGLYDDRIELAFWTFSHEGGLVSNYNQPFHGYASSKGISSTFNARLNAIASGGNTNYQQGFAYRNSVFNPSLKSIIDQTNIVVFMTDGLPNEPTGLFVATPRENGRRAAQAHQRAGRTVIGGSVGSNDTQRRTINYVVSGNQSNYNDTFVISNSFNDLAAKLKAEIGDKCRELFPPCPDNPSIPAESPECVRNTFSVRPTVAVTPGSISPGESVRYDYSIVTEGGVPGAITWNTIGLRVGAGVDVNALENPTTGYRDTNVASMSGVEAEVLQRIGGSSRATILPDTPNGSWRGGGVPAEDAVITSAARAGEKYCRILVLAEPTRDAMPRYRYSNAACVNIGFKPSVQVFGGDVITGRTIIGDEPISASESKIHTSLSSFGGKSYGSFGEYALRSSGPITGMASYSGLKEGAPLGDGAALSRLTFANTPSTGWFNETQPEYMPDTARQLLQTYNEALAPRLSGNVTLRDSMSGLYVASGDIEIGQYQLRVGQTLMVYAPRNTVTIGGNLTSPTEPLRRLEDIPQLVIVANKINIKGASTQVDAWLLARGEDASIDTCSDAPVKLTASVCNRPLRVNGPTMARYMQLKRTAGESATSGIAAETFNMRADAYMWAYHTVRNDRRIMTTHTIELAPRF